MKLVQKETSLVVTGAWNAAIVTPDWLLRYGLQTAAGAGAQIQVQIPAGTGIVFEFPRYTFEGITTQIRPDALVIRPEDASEESLAKVARLAKNSVAELKHTPIKGIGHNFEFQDENPEAQNLAAFTNAGLDLVDHLPNGWQSKKTTLSTAFAVNDIIVHVTRAFDGLKLSVKFNFHHPVTSHEQAIAILSGEGNFATLHANYLTARALVSAAYGDVTDE